MKTQVSNSWMLVVVAVIVLGTAAAIAKITWDKQPSGSHVAPTPPQSSAGRLNPIPAPLMKSQQASIATNRERRTLFPSPATDPYAAFSTKISASQAHNLTGTHGIGTEESPGVPGPEVRKKLATSYLANTMPMKQRDAYEEAIRRGIIPDPLHDNALIAMPLSEVMRLPRKNLP
jgi:hypothetical protein